MKKSEMGAAIWWREGILLILEAPSAQESRRFAQGSRVKESRVKALRARVKSEE